MVSFHYQFSVILTKTKTKTKNYENYQKEKVEGTGLIPTFSKPTIKVKRLNNISSVLKKITANK